MRRRRGPGVPLADALGANVVTVDLFEEKLAAMTRDETVGIPVIDEF